LIHPIGELAATNDLRHLSHRRDSTHANSSSKTSIFNSLLGIERRFTASKVSQA
jgi:hypothetical protein